MNVSLSSELEKFVRAQVESGLYNNASELVRESLRLMINLRRDELRTNIIQGINDAENGKHSTGKDVYKRLKASITAKGKKQWLSMLSPSKPNKILRK